MTNRRHCLMSPAESISLRLIDVIEGRLSAAGDGFERVHESIMTAELC